MSQEQDAPGTGPRDRASGIASAITSIVEACSSLLKLILIVVLLIIAWTNRGVVGPFFEHWFDTTTHLEVSAHGISLDRQVSAENTISKIAQRADADSNLPRVNAAFARVAIARASRNADAIKGARVLWVDGNPQNTMLEESVLTDMGIEVRRALNTKEAMSLLPGFKPDLIISNVVRDGDEKLPLADCPAHYFEVPMGLPVSLDKLNADTMSGIGRATGFSMAEAFSKSFPDYADHAQPRIIFYSASNGGIAASQCARLVTNRTDVLLQSVVSALEEFRTK